MTNAWSTKISGPPSISVLEPKKQFKNIHQILNIVILFYYYKYSPVILSVRLSIFEQRNRGTVIIWNHCKDLHTSNRIFKNNKTFFM